MGVGLITEPSASLQPETNHTAWLFCSPYQFSFFLFSCVSMVHAISFLVIGMQIHLLPK